MKYSEEDKKHPLYLSDCPKCGDENVALYSTGTCEDCYDKAIAQWELVETSIQE
jgi:hypothetical protein